MKKIWQLFAFALPLALVVVSCEQGGVADAKINDLNDSMSYAVGIFLGKQVPPDDFEELDITLIQKGLQDFKNEEMEITESEVVGIINKLSQRAQTRAAEQNQQAAAENQAEGETFLAENKTKEGVQTTASGLQYKVITEGSGTPPTSSDQVKVHYTGRLIDGTVFDSSVERGQPVTFPVTGVIQGWIEALQLMKPGAKWELYIPGNLGYGAQGSPPNIGPNQLLIFEVELLEIVGK